MTPNKRAHILYKDYRTLSSTLLKRSKTTYYNHYFDINCNIKNILEGIKSRMIIKNDISCQHVDIFNMLFTSDVFPSALKTAKVVPVHKKDSKQEFSNYQPISPLSNLDKILEKLMCSRIFKFFNNNNLFYPLQFGFRQNYSTTHGLISLNQNH